MFSKFNVNVKGATDQVIALLMEQFGENRGKLGYYRGLVKLCALPEVWLAATIETCVAMRRQVDPVRDPGRYFYNRVCTMAQSGIPAETNVQVQRYGCLTFAQLQAVLSNLPPPSPTGGSVRNTRPRLGAPPKMELRLARDRQISGMSQAALDQLRQEIQSRVEFCAWRTQGYYQADDTYALLVESPLRRQIWLYRCENWQARLATLLTPMSAEKQTGGH